MHLKIIKIVKVVNDAFGMQILLLMITSVIFTITFLYILYRIIWLDLTMDELIKELVSVICWFLVYASQILHVNYVCAKTNSEVQHFIRRNYRYTSINVWKLKDVNEHRRILKKKKERKVLFKYVSQNIYLKSCKIKIVERNEKHGNSYY